MRNVRKEAALSNTCRQGIIQRITQNPLLLLGFGFIRYYYDVACFTGSFQDWIEAYLKLTVNSFALKIFFL